MLVRYTGHGDMISADWNGKRYIFSKRRPVQEIPDGLYDFIKSSGFVFKHDVVVFHDNPVVEIKEPEIKLEPKKGDSDVKKRTYKRIAR